jgi:uncharacterized protein
MEDSTLAMISEMTNQYPRHKLMNNPLLLLLLTGVGLYFGKLWLDDLRAGVHRPAGSPSPLPGAASAPRRAVIVAVAGALVILAVETGGEIALGLAGEQSKMTVLFALYSILAAPLVEEIIFRGYLVVDPEKHGRRLAWLGALGASLLFAALHPFLWKNDDAGFALTLGPKGWFSTATVFATSLWLYAARLAKWNLQRSLLPCFAGHAAKNLGVFAIKAATGFVAGWW